MSTASTAASLRLTVNGKVREIRSINHPELPPYGAGEPGSVATAAALARRTA